MTSSCVNVARPPSVGCRQIAREVRDGKLDMGADAAAVDGVVLPRPALFPRPRVRVEVELADQRAGRVEDVEEAHVRVPGRRAAAADRDAVERLRDAKQSRQHFVFREVAAHFLLGKGEAPGLELLRRVRAVPRLQVVEPELGGSKSLELGVVALGKGPRAAREIAQERRARRRRSSPSSARARARRNSDSREGAPPRGAA